MNEATPLLARTHELERLDAFLERALAGDGQICMVAGRAGTGKTALVGEFVRRAQERYENLVVAVGACDAQTGMVNPYLPFREALNLLIGDVDERLTQNLVTHENLRRISQVTLKVAEILVDVGPDLIGLFVPGGDLMSKLATQAAKLGKTSLTKLDAFKHLEQRLKRPPSADAANRSALDQSQIYEQCTNVLCKLAEHQPLILVLDDLHWADTASIGLLFRLGRRLESSPILVVGAYRPDEIASGSEERHPLAKTLTEFKRYLGDIAVDLDRAVHDKGRDFVDAYLATIPNHLDAVFRERLFHHTGGHPLFTVELIRELQQQGSLVQAEDGAWIAGENLAWDALPARVEGVVEERCARLPPDLHRGLTVGSVEGERFTAEVVALVCATDARSLVRLLSGIAQTEQNLVEAQGVQRIGGKRLSSYEFSSSLIQTYLYGSLDAVEKSYLHEDVGAALETIYQADADVIAVQLARHFDQAALHDKALHYLRLAGDQAAAGYAHAEAVYHYSRALELTPATEPDARYALLLARERAFSMLGNRPAQLQDLDELIKLAQKSAKTASQAEAILRKAAYAVLVGDFQGALADAQAAVGLAVQAGDPILQAQALYRCGSACWQMGRYADARRQLEQALALNPDEANAGLEADLRYELGLVGYYEDAYEVALGHLQAAAACFTDLGDRQGEARCLSLSGMILDSTGDHGAAMTKFAAALKLARQVGWRYAEARFLNQSGDNLIQLGYFDRAQEQLQQAVALASEIEDHDAVAKSLDMCGLAALFQRRFEIARAYFDEALTRHREANSLRGQGFVLTHLGYLLIETEEWEPAIDTLHQAWEMRRQIDAQALIMDTLAALARLALRLDDLAAAGEYVDEILTWMQANGVNGIEYPLQVILICYEVLAARGKTDAVSLEQAQALLADGHERLMARADRMQEDVRKQFLTCVPFNRDLHQYWMAAEACLLNKGDCPG